MKTIYQTKINKIGSSVSDFLGEKMFILFGDNAPAELSDYCLLINVNEIEGEIEQGDVLAFNNQEYTITAVGSAVKQNLGSLGHITLKFDGSDTSELPGTLYLEEADIQVPEAGSLIQILKK
ncbi:PTS glucitol/sorbitol transporter subunit IIA [Bacillus taeanensis]|uniref:PTS sorbitol transporter subunit IIA n=1 Tax=Bacillus taeanensis TaxID=273032 RepID=A0A366XSH9_9BACI|nr:PTS glucitol/sorbitol transporter subunit IIA [Bacillus taeanensis]RBW68508.1 PTS sorbitol transporter subunit IIA [Bacillus taeanensis]